MAAAVRIPLTSYRERVNDPSGKNEQARILGRFRSKYLNGDLKRIVREVALQVRPNAPAKLSQSQFDNNVAGVGYPDCPTGRQISTRLRQSWPDLVESAIKPEPEHKQALVVKLREEPASYITDRHVFFSLRRVARALNAQSFTDDDYEETREQLVDEDARRWRYGGVLQETLLTKSQVLNYVGHDWNKALKLAGLKPYAQNVARGMPIREAIHLYVLSTSLMAPSYNELKRMSDELGFALRDQKKELSENGKTWPDHVAEYEAWCAEQGLELPAAKTRQRERPVFNPPAGALDGATKKKRRGAWTEPECVAALVEFVDRWPGTIDPSQGQYLNAQKGNREWPPPSTFQKYGGYEAMLEKAREIRRDREKKAA
jgi:hypothetical protein